MKKEITIENIPMLGDGWKKRKEECIFYPEKPNIPAMEVWRHLGLEKAIIRRFSVDGKLIFSNADRYGYLC